MYKVLALTGMEYSVDMMLTWDDFVSEALGYVQFKRKPAEFLDWLARSAIDDMEDDKLREVIDEAVLIGEDLFEDLTAEEELRRFVSDVLVARVGDPVVVNPAEPSQNPITSTTQSSSVISSLVSIADSDRRPSASDLMPMSL